MKSVFFIFVLLESWSVSSSISSSNGSDLDLLQVKIERLLDRGGISVLQLNCSFGTKPTGTKPTCWVERLKNKGSLGKKNITLTEAQKWVDEYLLRRSEKSNVLTPPSPDVNHKRRRLITWIVTDQKRKSEGSLSRKDALDQNLVLLESELSSVVDE